MGSIGIPFVFRHGPEDSTCVSHYSHSGGDSAVHLGDRFERREELAGSIARPTLEGSSGIRFGIPASSEQLSGAECWAPTRVVLAVRGACSNGPSC